MCRSKPDDEAQILDKVSGRIEWRSKLDELQILDRARLDEAQILDRASGASLREPGRYCIL